MSGRHGGVVLVGDGDEPLRPGESLARSVRVGRGRRLVLVDDRRDRVDVRPVSVSGRGVPSEEDGLLHGLEVEEIRPLGNVASAAGSVLSHYLLRHWAAKTRKHDGSVVMSRWRGVLTMPFVFLTQSIFFVAERFAKDDALCLGYSVVARKS